MFLRFASLEVSRMMEPESSELSEWEMRRDSKYTLGLQKFERKENRRDWCGWICQ